MEDCEFYRKIRMFTEILGITLDIGNCSGGLGTFMDYWEFDWKIGILTGGLRILQEDWEFYLRIENFTGGLANFT